MITYDDLNDHNDPPGEPLTYEAIVNQLEAAKAAVPAETSRTIFYLPFSPDQDPPAGGLGLREKVDAYQAQVSLRGLASKLAPEGDENLTTDQLAAQFNTLGPQRQARLLLDTARKTPLIKQHGVPDGHEVKASDTVQVYAHGHKNLNFLAAVQKDARPDQRCSVQRLVDQMEQDGIPGNVAKIKLLACGSGAGEFHKALVEHCDDKGLFNDTNIIGYKGETHYLFDAARPLEQLDKGRHKVLGVGVEEKITADHKDSAKPYASIHDELRAAFEELEGRKNTHEHFSKPDKPKEPCSKEELESYQSMMKEYESDLAKLCSQVRDLDEFLKALDNKINAVAEAHTTNLEAAMKRGSSPEVKVDKTTVRDMLRAQNALSKGGGENHQSCHIM
ncbi:MAG: hypothetical protein WAW39_21280 [Prosthecobacter sp.]|uniref:hypothetical protein n=1 Tax=Prosthecobacter sp. TaxID=1965333 RepID=UPI003BAF638A